MALSDLSPSMQNYLKVIWGVEELSDAPVTASLIAERSGLRTSSVSDAVRRLTELGLVEHEPYGSIALTGPGRAYAVAMVRRHRLLETFLVQVLGYGWDEVHDEADVLEHAVSDLLIERVDRVLGQPRLDPHGDPIPAADGSVAASGAVPLSGVTPGRQVLIERVSDADPALLQHFGAHGLVVGVTLDVLDPEPFSDTIRVRLTGHDAVLALGRAALGAVWVSQVDPTG